MLLNLNILLVVLQLAVHQCRSISLSSSSSSIVADQDQVNSDTQRGEIFLQRRAPVMYIKEPSASSLHSPYSSSPEFTPFASPEHSASTSTGNGRKKVQWADQRDHALTIPLEPSQGASVEWKPSVVNGRLEPLPKLPETIKTKDKHRLLAFANHVRAETLYENGLMNSKKTVRFGAKLGRYHLENSIDQWKEGHTKESLKEAGKAVVKPVAAVAFSPVPLLGGLTESLKFRSKALKHKIIHNRAPEGQDSRTARDNVQDRLDNIHQALEPNKVTHRFVSKVLRPEPGKVLEKKPEEEAKKPYRSLDGPITMVHEEETTPAKAPFDFNSLRVEIPRPKVDGWATSSSGQIPLSRAGPRLMRQNRLPSSYRNSPTSLFSATPSPASPVFSSSEESPASPTLSDADKIISPNAENLDGFITMDFTHQGEEEPRLPALQTRIDRQLSGIPEGSESDEDLYSPRLL